MLFKIYDFLKENLLIIIFIFCMLVVVFSI